MINGFSQLSYQERLKRTNLMSLEIRRLRADLLQVYKIMHELEGLQKEDFFEMANSRLTTRGHEFKIYKQRARLDARKFFFSQRVVDEWNSLRPEIVNANSVNAFKNSLDPILKSRGGHFISQRRLPAPLMKTTRELDSN